MFSGCLQDFSRMFSGCSDGSCGPGGIRWSFQMKVWTLMIQRNPMIPIYSIIPAIWRSQLLIDPQLFDDPQLFNDPQLFDDQLEVWTLIIWKSTVIPPSPMVLFFFGILPSVCELCAVKRWTHWPLSHPTPLQVWPQPFLIGTWPPSNPAEQHIGWNSIDPPFANIFLWFWFKANII